MAGLFFAFSLLPSLLPRAGYVQGIASGVTLMIGYGIGAGCQALWDYLEIPKLRGRARSDRHGHPARSGRVAAVVSAWQQVGWQNEIRSIVRQAARVAGHVARHRRRHGRWSRPCS